MYEQGDMFAEPPRLPAKIGRVQETREFYVRAAEQAISMVGFQCPRLQLRISRHGFVEVDAVPAEPDMKWHVITINHKSDPDAVAEELESKAIELGFDEGIRRGRKRCD